MNVFSLIGSEAGIASDQLAHGIVLLNRVRLDEPELFAQAFFPLTVGLERSAKLIYVIDKYDTAGRFPTDAQLRRFGHGLKRLFDYIESDIVPRLRLAEESIRRPALPVHTAIIECLDLFASSDGRYYNLITLGGSTDSIDPVNQWINTVVIPTYQEQSSDGSDVMFLKSSGLERTLAEFNVRSTTEPFVRLAVLQIIRWLSRIIMNLGESQHAMLPYMPDFFDRFEHSDSYFIKHKTYPGRS